MPSYPANIFNPATNVDDSTVVNAAYMDQRDEEIKAIENALGGGLVPGPGGNPTYSLVSRVQVDSNGNLRLTNGGGNVSVGPTNPGTTSLFVYSLTDAKIRVQSADGFASYVLKAANYNQWEMWTPNTVDNRLEFWNGGTHKMVILANGNVGIGTNGPVARLEVNGSVKIGGNVGFYGTTPQPKPTVNTSTGGNLALEQLLAGLHGLGLIDNQT